MLKKIFKRVFVFDVEWVPDPLAAKLLYKKDFENDKEAFEALWKYTRTKGAIDKEEIIEDIKANPQPYIKTILCKIVSIAGVSRRAVQGKAPLLELVTFPKNASNPKEALEVAILENFLSAFQFGKEYDLQLVGYNSSQADIPIIAQRAMLNGLNGQLFGKRPDKPWLGNDYLAGRNTSDCHIDLQFALLGEYNNAPRLHEAAVNCGIPGKFGIPGEEALSGNKVWESYLKGDEGLADIITYNQYDALTTYLLWVRMAYFSGIFTDEAYALEQEAVKQLIQDNLSTYPNLKAYQEEWDRIEGDVSQARR